MSAAKFFIILLIPLIILGFGIWVSASSDVDRNSVQIAGAMISSADVDLTIKGCRISEEGGSRRLEVELDASNVGSQNVDVNPRNFQLVLARNETGATAARGVFQPTYFTSVCAEAPNDAAIIPPHAVRSYSLRFWGGTLPTGEGWNDYYLSLEYYDPSFPLLFSKPLNPEGK